MSTSSKVVRSNVYKFKSGSKNTTNLGKYTDDDNADLQPIDADSPEMLADEASQRADTYTESSAENRNGQSETQTQATKSLEKIPKVVECKTQKRFSKVRFPKASYIVKLSEEMKQSVAEPNELMSMLTAVQEDHSFLRIHCVPRPRLSSSATIAAVAGRCSQSCRRNPTLKLQASQAAGDLLPVAGDTSPGQKVAGDMDRPSERAITVNSDKSSTHGQLSPSS
ncbi:hypothetical protein PR048_010333 [Dryococelus australis]|uniref:Uncharacterized protein n=1 Tax=Dryococelus australis TaxID=614101 RepID=A0ABQ9I2G6_9NEOP|nr:hypothetical protein PR048_010333 [Dryococelus australis]